MLVTCWQITLTNGTVLGFTDSDEIQTYGGVTFERSSAYTRSSIQSKSDLSVPNLEVDGLLRSDAIKDSDIRAGLYDFAQVKLFMMVPGDTNGATYGIVKLRNGWLGQVSLEQGTYKAEFRGLPSLLAINFLEIFTLDCQADFGDSRCKYPLASVRDTGTVSVVTTPYRAFQFTLSAVGAPLTISTLTGTLAVNSEVITALSSNPITAGVTVGMSIAGTGIPAFTYVEAVTSTTITLTVPATVAGTAVALTITGGQSTSYGSLTGTVTAGSETITSLSTNPLTLGIQIGMAISGTGIPAGTQIECSTTTGSTHLTNLNFSPIIAGAQIGAAVSGAGIPTGCYIVNMTATEIILGNASGAGYTTGSTYVNTAAECTATASNVPITIAGAAPGSTVITGVTATTITMSNPASTSHTGVALSIGRAPSIYNFGLVTWLTGENAGLTMEVKTYDGGTLTLYLNMGYPIQVGDTFTVIPGCDKSMQTCINTYNNLVNNRGFPYIPGLDKMLYPNANIQNSNSI